MAVIQTGRFTKEYAGPYTSDAGDGETGIDLSAEARSGGIGNAHERPMTVTILTAGSGALTLKRGGKVIALSGLADGDSVSLPRAATKLLASGTSVTLIRVTWS